MYIFMIRKLREKSSGQQRGKCGIVVHVGKCFILVAILDAILKSRNNRYLNLSKTLKQTGDGHIDGHLGKRTSDCTRMVKMVKTMCI